MTEKTYLSECLVSLQNEIEEDIARETKKPFDCKAFSLVPTQFMDFSYLSVGNDDMVSSCMVDKNFKRITEWKIIEREVKK